MIPGNSAKKSNTLQHTTGLRLRHGEWILFLWQNERPPNFEWKNLIHLKCINNHSKNQNQNKSCHLLQSSCLFHVFPFLKFSVVRSTHQCLFTSYEDNKITPRKRSTYWFIINTWLIFNRTIPIWEFFSIYNWNKAKIFLSWY